MAKQNNSDYMRWAQRRSTEYLAKLVAEANARTGVARLNGTRIKFHPKVLAAARVLLERSTPNPNENQS